MVGIRCELIKKLIDFQLIPSVVVLRNGRSTNRCNEINYVLFIFLYWFVFFPWPVSNVGASALAALLDRCASIEFNWQSKFYKNWNSITLFCLLLFFMISFCSESVWSMFARSTCTWTHWWSRGRSRAWRRGWGQGEEAGIGPGWSSAHRFRNVESFGR